MSLINGFMYLIGDAVIRNRQRRRKKVEIDTSVGEWIYDQSMRDYVWIEKLEEPNPHYLSVLKFDEEHVIFVDKEPREHSIDIVRCENLTEVEIAVKMFKAGYRTQGKVRVESCLTENKV